jgi:SAM-dependent methyltransferase
MSSATEEIPALVGDENHYPAILKLFDGAKPGRILDVPSGHGAFALELAKRGFNDIDCLDLYAENWRLNAPGIRFLQHDVRRPLPFADHSFDYVFSIEGLEHFDNPFVFVAELCRVLKPGGRMFLTTPNIMSVDARLKFLVSGYFPRFRPLMQTPEQVVKESEVHAHISPIYFWQLNYYLLKGGVRVSRVSTNTLVYKPQWVKRAFENWVARLVRNNIRKRGFPDHGMTSESMLFGDCIIVEGLKAE